MREYIINNYLKICENIKEYKEREFEEEINPRTDLFNKNYVCDLAYTNYGDNEELELNVKLDLTSLKLIKEMKPTDNILSKQFKHVEITKFKNIKEIVDFTEFLDFNMLVVMDVESEELLEEWFNI
ncbi:hypothetical protein QLG35_11105 [Staphylococcus aureus]|jgi:hypothetical protein|uniref:hypothetical protein n=1 Tax=Staphylococcus aureus TaxID=1280 RepID=UPI00289219B3|nr:hypothetical protein [Staphylococcus aureus]MDT3056753.1 hypothetical protein [Staphylococcus aureus]HDC7602942.1 hypothetical protein [Staphylococcus aureus]HDD6623569.1 hypothetical protein [Staphylococcus aureus]HEI6472522.1 hypothetical protein [Staphylococcus aureus]HEI6614452.1 hypothetical protein [Staphylococcus aureus]